MGFDPITIGAGALIGSSVIGAITGSKAAGAQADAANNAAQSQANSASQSLDVQKQMFDEQVALNKPWQDAGLVALKNYADNPAFKFSATDFTADPSYQFRKEQGVNALDMSASSRGKLLSGAQDKALTQYGQDLASTEYGNAYNRALQNYNTNQNTQLNLANIGRGASGQTQQATQNFANQASNAYTAQGNAYATGAVNSANAYAQGQAGIANTLNNGIANGLYMYGATK